MEQAISNLSANSRKLSKRYRRRLTNHFGLEAEQILPESCRRADAPLSHTALVQLYKLSKYVPELRALRSLVEGAVQERLAAEEPGSPTWATGMDLERVSKRVNGWRRRMGVTKVGNVLPGRDGGEKVTWAAVGLQWPGDRAALGVGEVWKKMKRE